MQDFFPELTSLHVKQQALTSQTDLNITIIGQMNFLEVLAHSHTCRAMEASVLQS